MKGTEEYDKLTQECNQQNPNCGKPYSAYKTISSTNKGGKRRDEGEEN